LAVSPWSAVIAEWLFRPGVQRMAVSPGSAVIGRFALECSDCLFQTYLVVTCDKGSESAPNAEQQDEHPSSENNTNGTVDNAHT